MVEDCWIVVVPAIPEAVDVDSDGVDAASVDVVDFEAAPTVARPSIISALPGSSHWIDIPDALPRGRAKHLWPAGQLAVMYLPSGSQFASCSPMQATR